MRIALRRALTTAATAAIVGGGLFVSPPAALASSACSSDCINVSNVSGTPDGAFLAFSTTALSRVKVVVTNLNGSSAYVVKQDDSWGSNYEVTADDSNRFTQGTVYKFVIYATDTSGATWSYSGEFATLVRKASIHYSNLHIYNDGDYIGPGDFAGQGRCVDGSTWLDLPPLPDWQLSSNKVELSDGGNQPLNDTYSCGGVIGKAVDAQTAVVDDDFQQLDPSPEFFDATSPYDWRRWTSHDFDAGYTAQLVSDPLDPTATGTGSTPINVTSPATDPVGYAVGMRYQITGSATFQHLAPMVNLPAPTNGPVTLHPQVVKGYGADVAVISWQPQSDPLFSGMTPTRVQWKPHSSATWDYTTMLDPSASSLQLTNLKLGTLYDVAVSRVMPGNLLALYGTTSYLTPGVATSPTTISGWSTATVTASVGTTVTSAVQVSTNGAARNVVLQSKASGQFSWTTAATVLTDASGHATLAYKVVPGYTQWRLQVPAAGNYDAATSGTRTLVAQTYISSFNATTVTAPTGTTVYDTVYVSPANQRAVTLYYRPYGTSTWLVQAKLITDAAGKVVLPELARWGTYQWELFVPADPKQGNGSWSSIRIIHGN